MCPWWPEAQPSASSILPLCICVIVSRLDALYVSLSPLPPSTYARYAYTGSLVPDNTIDLCAAMRSALDASTFGHLCELSKDCFSFVCRVSVDVGCVDGALEALPGLLRSRRAGSDQLCR
jgi:hypothetical protein